MPDSLLKMFGSVRLVQEISRSSPQSSSSSSNPTSLTSAATTTSLNEQEAQKLTVTDTPFASQKENSEEQSQAAGNTDNEQLLPTQQQPGNTSLPGTFEWQPQRAFSMSLAKYLPGVPRYASSYASRPPPFPSWLMPPPPSPSSSTTTTTTANNSSLPNAKPRRKHVRKNSLYSVRHHRPKQPSSSKTTAATNKEPAASQPTTTTPLQVAVNFNDEKQQPAFPLCKIKPKSQKLLCLWPLPVITRYIIGISLLVSALNFIGAIHLKCSSPSFVIHRLEIGNLLLSPFLFTGSLHTFLLFAWNILILGLFEESLAHMLGGTRRFLKVLIGIILSVCMIRQGIGYLFSKSTGFAVPSLFFSDSLHECNQGLAPFLFALLIVQSLSIDDKYILMYGSEDSNHQVTVRKFVLQLLMCLVNYTVKNILWWSLTGLLTGYIATIVIQTCLAARQRKWDDEDDSSSSSIDFWTTRTKDESVGFDLERRVPLWRVLWSAVKKGAVVLMITLPLLLLCNAYYTRETFVDPAALNQVTHDRYMFTFVVMTAPRRGDPPFLSQTLESYIANWPANPEPGSLYDRLQAIVYTHFTNHTQYDLAKARFSADSRGQRYFKWVREEGNVFDQRLHVSKALSLAADNYQSTYIALLEDDFPICGKNEWRQIENVIYGANQRVPGHCGVFVGTGGSGLFMKPKIAKLLSGLLLKYTDMPPDIVLQNCLTGNLAECSECSQTLVTSKTLLMYHIGFNTSTSQDRTYRKHDFQCGWRHPFNGDPEIITL